MQKFYSNIVSISKPNSFWPNTIICTQLWLVKDILGEIKFQPREIWAIFNQVNSLNNQSSSFSLFLSTSTAATTSLSPAAIQGCCRHSQPPPTTSPYSQHHRPPSPTPTTIKHHLNLHIFKHKWANFISFLANFCFWFLFSLVFIVDHAILIRIRVIFEVVKRWLSIKHVRVENVHDHAIV